MLECLFRKLYSATSYLIRFKIFSSFSLFILVAAIALPEILLLTAADCPIGASVGLFDCSCRASSKLNACSQQ